MNKQSIAVLAGTHVLAIVAGLLLAHRSAGGRPETETEVARGKIDRPAPSGNDVRTRSVHFRPTKDWRASEYARAWKAVRTAQLSTVERIEVQRELLKNWGELDLAAAIEAALGEAWDGDMGGYYNSSGPLLDALSEALAKDPAVGWDMIRGRQFGVATGMVRHVWLEAVGKKDPLFLAARIGELSWRDRQEALMFCRSGISHDVGGVTGNHVLKILSSFPEDVVTAEQLMRFVTDSGESQDPAAMKQEILNLAAGDERMAKVRAMLLGKMLSSKSPSEIESEIGDLPAGIREEVLWAAFKNGNTPKSTLGVLDLLVAQDAWDKLETRETAARIQMLARNDAAEEVAGWATSLPVRKETTELFHRSVEGYFRKDIENSRAWIAEIPPGVWQDRAYAEYSQVALHVHNNPEASRWALDRIGDSAFKGEAEGWRADWEKRNRREP